MGSYLLGAIGMYGTYQLCAKMTKLNSYDVFVIAASAQVVCIQAAYLSYLYSRTEKRYLVNALFEKQRWIKALDDMWLILKKGTHSALPSAFDLVGFFLTTQALKKNQVELAAYMLNQFFYTSITTLESVLFPP